LTNDLVSHSNRAHSLIGGSTAKITMECPGSLRLRGKYPSIVSDFASEGTALHEAVDFILQQKVEKDRDVIGLTFNGYVIDEAMYEEAVLPALEQFDKLDDELGGIDYFNEERVVFPEIEDAFGTVDIVGAARDRTVVLDWKFGRGVAVDAVENAQMMYYAVAAMHTEKTAKFFAKDRPVELFIVQPRVNDGEPFTRWMTTPLQLEAWALEFRNAVKAAELPDAPLKLGAHCKFCSAKPGCPAYNNLAQDTLALTPDERRAKLEQILPYADLFIELGNDIKAMAHAHLEQGHPIEGWKLVNKRAQRSWVDDDKALRYLTKAGLPAAERYVKKFLSPKQAEDALKRNNLPAQLPKGLVEAVSSGTTLAPASDPRPEVPVSASVMQQLAASLAARS
jgi:hypothetical protein